MSFDKPSDLEEDVPLQDEMNNNAIERAKGLFWKLLASEIVPRYTEKDHIAEVLRNIEEAVRDDSEEDRELQGATQDALTDFLTEVKELTRQ